MRNFRQSVDWNKYLTTNDVVCFSPVSWDQAHKRQVHLMNNFSKTFRVFFVEEPIFHNGEDGYAITPSRDNNIYIVTPYLQENTVVNNDVVLRQKSLITKLFIDNKIKKFVAWYYTPFALSISSHLEPEMYVYDCIDELTSFTSQSPEKIQFYETEIFKRAKVVFTDSKNLYEVKKHAHNNIYSFENTHLDKSTTEITDIFNENLLEKSSKETDRTLFQSVA